MLQIVCSCGRIAEVRHKSTGKKLAYTHCVECGTDLGSTKKAAVVEANAKTDIGVKGDFFERDSKIINETSVSSSIEKSKNFKPEIEDLPEVLECETETNNEQNTDKPSSNGNGLGIVAGLLVMGALAFAGFKVSTNLAK
jgi:hypothetical protein